MIPVIGVVGWHRSGKTTFVVGLIRALAARGIRVATIKHTSEAIAMDREGTDTSLFTQAGSLFVAIAGPQGSAILLPQPPEPTFWELAALVPADVGLIIVEGYKRLALPKFEVIADNGAPSTPPAELFAVITRDGSAPARGLPDGVPVLAAGDYEGAVNLLNSKGVLNRGVQTAE